MLIKPEKSVQIQEMYNNAKRLNKRYGLYNDPFLLRSIKECVIILSDLCGVSVFQSVK